MPYMITSPPRGMGDTYSLKGKIDDHHYIIFCLKEPDYAMKIMSNYSGLTEYPSQKVSMRSLTNTTGEAKTTQFKYNIPF